MDTQPDAIGSVLAWLALIASALIVGISKAGFGAGVGILAIPLMALAVGSERMLGLLLPVLILGDVFSVVHYIKAYDGRTLAGLLAGCAPGVACGVALLGWFRTLQDGPRFLDGSVGVLCAVFVCIQAVLSCRKAASAPTQTVRRHPAGIVLAVVVGLLAGTASTLSHAAGPIIAMFLLPLGYDKRTFVGTTAWFFLGCNLMKLGPFIYERLVTARTALELVYLAPAVIAGTFLGSWLNKKVSPRTFNIVVYALVFATGVRLALRLFGI